MDHLDHHDDDDCGGEEEAGDDHNDRGSNRARRHPRSGSTYGSHSVRLRILSGAFVPFTLAQEIRRVDKFTCFVSPSRLPCPRGVVRF